MPIFNDPTEAAVKEAAAGLDLSRPATPADMEAPALTDAVATQNALNSIQRANAREKTSYWQLAQDIGKGTLTGIIVDHTMADAAPPPDPNYSNDQHLAYIQEAQKHLPEEWVWTLKNAQSAAEFSYLYRRALDAVEAQKRLAEAGWGTWGANLAANFLDPVSLAVAIPAGGGMMHFAKTAKVGTAGWLGANAALGGGFGAGTEILKRQLGEGVSNDQILYATGLGMALGAGFGTLIQNPAAAREAAVIARAGQQLQALGTSLAARYRTMKPGASQAGVKRAEQAAAEVKPIEPAPTSADAAKAAAVSEPLPGVKPGEQPTYDPAALNETPAAPEQLAQEAAAKAPAPEPAPAPKQEPSQLKAQADEIIKANADILGPEGTKAAQALVTQVEKTVAPEPVAAPAPAPTRVTTLTELDPTPQLQRNPRFISRWASPDGGEYTIMAETADLSGPYMIRRVGDPVAFGKGFNTLAEAKAHIPIAGTAQDPRVIAEQAVMAQLAEAKPLPGKLDGNEVEGFRFRSFIYKLDPSSTDKVKVFNAFKQGSDQNLGYVEITMQQDGRWKVSMIEVPEEFRKSPSAFGLLKVAEKVNEGKPIIPDGTLLPDGYAHWKDRLQWVKDWYRPQPEKPEGGWLSPRQLLLNRELIAMDLEANAGASPKQVAKLRDRLAKYDEALRSLPPEALDPANLREMFKFRGDPMENAGAIKPAVAPELYREVFDILNRIAPKSVKTGLYDGPLSLKGMQADAFYSHADRSIHISLLGPEARVKAAAFHETLHSLRALGLFTPGEWKLLYDWSAKIPRNYDEKAYRAYFETFYKNSDPVTRDYHVNSLMAEEQVAHALGNYMAGNLKPTGAIRAVFDRIIEFFRSIRDALGIQGRMTVQDVFDGINSGRIGSRSPLDTHRAFRSSPASDPVMPSLAPEADPLGAPTTPPWLEQDGTWNSLVQEDVSRPARPLGLPRMDRAGRAGQTDNAAARLVSRLLHNDTVGQHDNSVNPLSADIEQRRIKAVYLGEYDRARIAAHDAWSKDLKLGPVERLTRADEFYRDVGEYVAGRSPGKEFHPAVKQLGDHVRRIQADILESLQNPQRFPFAEPGTTQLEGRPILGADTVATNSNYLWRKIDHRQMLGAIDRFGESGVATMVKGAIRSAQPDIDAEVLDALARGYVRGVHKRAAGLGDEWSIALGEGNKERLGQLLREDGALSNEKVDELLTKLYAGKEKTADMTNLKRRVLLDEGYVQKGLSTTDGSVGDLAFADLLDNNINSLVEGYVRRASGRIALGRVRFTLPERATAPGQVDGGTTLIDGLTSNAEIDALLARVAKWGADNVPNYNPQRDLNYLRFAFDRILGHTDPAQMTNLAQVLRDLRKFNVTRLMGQVGFAQVGESGNAVASLGLKAAFAHVPGFKRIIDATGKSRLNSDLFHELESIGIGTERLHGMHYHNLDEIGDLPFEVRPASLHDRISRDLGIAEKATYELSGMSVTQMLQERATAAAIAQKFANMAQKVQEGKSLSRAELRRFAQMGLDESMTQRVLAQFKHADQTDGVMFANKLTRLNVHKWDDLEARAAFEGAVFRHTAKLIQQGDVGSAATFMSEPIWQTIFQFRAFPFMAWQNQFLYNLHMRDMAAFNTFVWTTAWNAVVRAAQIQLLSVGRSDRDKYLEKNLSSWELAKAGFQRAGWSSIIPQAIDTGLVFAGQDGAFNARSSGQPADVFLGSPVVSLYNQGMKGVGGIIGAQIDGRQSSQAAIRNAASMLPFQNMMPFAQLLNTMISDRPDRDPKKPHTN